VESNETVTRELTADEQKRLSDLDEAIAKFEGQKRWSDVIKSILAKADIVVAPADKVALLSQAGQLYIERSSNQAEAIKCYEAVLELDSHNLTALTNLKEMYEKRRDWEKLVRAMEREAELLDESDRGMRYLEMAQLATEKLRKPEICIDLWQKVLTYEADQPDALTALSGLYERAREWQPLANVLEKQIEQAASSDDQKALLTKLGTIYADKLNDDRGAVSAYSRLLAFDPEDKRAQEQLKRRYVAIKAWDELEAFYEPSGKFDELIRTFEREAGNKEASKEEQVDLFFRVARLWERQDKSDRAAKAYEKVLELDAENLAAAVALTPIYEAANDAKKLAGAYEVRLKHPSAEGESEERIVLLREAGVLYEEKLKKPDLAFARFLEALRIDPMRDILREDVARLAPAVNGWEQVVSAYEAGIAATTDEDAQLDLRMQLGGVLTGMGKVEDAIAQYRGVYDARSDHGGAIEALELLYRQTNKYAELLDIYDRRMELEADSDARRRIAYGRASLLQSELADAGRAIEAYRAILAEWGDDESEAYRALDELFEKEARFKDLAETLERRIDLGPETPEELAALKYRLARVLDQHLNDKERSLDLLREVVTLLPDHDGARAALEAYLPDPKLGVAAAQILEPLYEARSDWESLIRALEVLAAGADEPEKKRDLYTKIGETAGGQMGDLRRAFDAFGRGFKETPDHEPTLGQLEEIASARTWWDDLVNLLGEQAGATSDPMLARSLWIRAANLHEGKRNDVDAAVAAYAKVLAADAGDAEVLDALDALYRRTERWRDLLGVLRKKGELAADGEQQEELLAQVAQIHEDLLNEPDQAIGVYKEVLELDPTSRRGLSSLDRLFEKQERWTDLADNIGRQLTLTSDPDEQTSLQLRLAALRESRMGGAEAAIEIHREILERDPSNEASLGALERLLAVAAHQPVITEILEPLYQNANEFGKLVGVLEIQTTHASSPEQRVELLHRISELQEVALDDAPTAFASMARALAEDSGNTTTVERLERLAAATGDAQALAKVYEDQADVLIAALRPLEEGGDPPDTTLATTHLVRAAEIREEALNDTATAIAHYRRVLTVDPAHLGAATALERLYQQSEQWEALAGILLTKSKMLDIPDDQKEHLFRAASIYEELLERPTDAITVYHQVLEVDPEEIAALDKLTELNLKLEKWPELLDVYTKKADVVSDPDEKKRLYLEVGAVYERELNDTAKATDTYARILEIDPDDLTAIQRLDALHQAAGNWQELLQILEREADLASDPNEVTSYRYRIAELWDHKLNDAGKAIDGYAGILDSTPDHQPTLDALEAMIRAGKEPVRAATTLEPIYQQFGEFAKLAAVLEVQVAAEEDPVRKIELLHRIAELQETQLEALRPAFDAYARALPLDSAHDHTLASLERLASQMADAGVENAHLEVAKLYDLELDKLAESPDRLVELGMRTAQIYEVQIGDVESAIARYNRVLGADEAQPQAIESLDRLYAATERWSDLARILAKEAENAASPEETLDFQFRLGQVHEHHLGQVDQAIQQYKEILAAAPEHAPALSALESLFENGVQPLAIGEVLEPLYRMSENWERLVGVQEVQLANTADAEARLQMIHRIAEIAEDRAMEPQLAFEWHQRALLMSPLDERSVGDTDRLAASLQNWEQLADSLATILEEQKDKATRVAVGRRLARIYEQELGDAQRAVDTHLFVLTADPADAETLENLDRIYTENGASEALQEVLSRRAGAAEETRDKVEFLFRRGQVLENDLGRIDEAVGVYRTVLGATPETGLDAEHEGSIRALANIYTEKQDWKSLAGVFERELAIAMGESGRSDVLAKTARLASDHLKDDARSIALWRQVLDLRGEDLEALNALGELHARGSDWNALVDVLDREAAIAADDETRVQILSDLGRVYYVKLKNERSAIDNWQRVLDIDPTNEGALFALVDIHRNAFTGAGGIAAAASGAANAQELVDALHRVIEVGTATLDESIIETCYMQLGELYERALVQPRDAIDAYGKALDLNAKNFVAMDALERLHSADSEWAETIEVMERRADALEAPEDKIVVLGNIARMWAEQEGTPDRGTSAYQRIVGLAPSHKEAFERLEVLHRDAERWDDLVEMYLTRVENTEATKDRVGLLRKVADVQERNLGDKEQAFGALQIAWEEDFTDPKTAEELERMAGLTQKWNDLLGIANNALKQVTDPRTKIAICLSCAKWYGTQLGHPEYAIPYYQQILALDPANVAAMRQMADLYRSTGQWQTLAQVLGRLVDITPDASDKAGVYVQMGELAEQHLNMRDQARAYYRQALDTDPKHVGALEALERVYRASGEWNELLDVLRRKADALEDPVAVLEAKLQIAEAYEDRTGNTDEAISTYAQVLEADPQSLRAMKGLERLYSQKERWPDLLTVLEKQYEVVTTEKERISILLRVAAMWEEEFVKPEKAAERLEQVLEIDPTNEQALRGLERLYKNMQRWDKLIETYDRHVSATPDRGEKQMLLCAMGEVQHVELNDLDRSIDAYLSVLSINNDNVTAHDALSRIYDKRGDHGQALDSMGVLSRLLQDPQQVVDLRFRMGKLLDEKLGDRASAVDAYQSAIDVEPGHLPSLEAMRKIHLDAGDWLAAAKSLEQEAQYQQQPRLIARLLVELGKLYDERLDEHERAIEVFEAALRQDADNEDAALPLADEYAREKRWAEAAPLFDSLVKRSAKRDPAEQQRLAFMLGQSATEIGDNDAAIRALSKASQLDPQHLPTLVALSNAYYVAQNWDQAFKHFQMVLVHHRDALQKEELVDVFFKLGVIKREQGDRRKALNMFDKALEEDAGHRPTLEAVVGLYEGSGDWEQVIHFKKQILEQLDGTERFAMLEAIGDLWQEKLKNAPKAIEHYALASELQPKNHKILHKLLGLYQSTKLWDQAIEIIERVSGLVDDMDVSDETKKGQQSKYAYTIAVVLRDEVKDTDRSIEYFNKSLDLDSSQLKAFEAINKILNTRKEWKPLERAYRKMLHRIAGKGNTDLEFSLWETLGLIYRDRLKQPENAIEAFKVAASLKPDNEKQHLILAELYAGLPGKTDEAILEHQWLLKQDPYRVDSYQALYKLYFDARAYDKAWCLAATLAFLKKADNEQVQYFEQYRQKGPIRPASRLDNERWLKDLVHPEEDLVVAKIFEQVWPALLSLRGKPDKDAGLAAKYAVDPATHTGTMPRTFGFVSQVLGLPDAAPLPPHRRPGWPHPHAGVPARVALGCDAPLGVPAPGLDVHLRAAPLRLPR
jgi:tetratricopeptide (TPR) repeat protein